MAVNRLLVKNNNYGLLLAYTAKFSFIGCIVNFYTYDFPLSVRDAQECY